MTLKVGDIGYSVEGSLELRFEAESASVAGEVAPNEAALENLVRSLSLFARPVAPWLVFTVSPVSCSVARSVAIHHRRKRQRYARR